MAEPLVPGPSAGRWDLSRRLALLVTVLLVAIAAGLLAVGVVPAIVVGALALAALVLAIVLGARGSRAMALERAAGYSTVYDFAGFELRDPRTLGVLRARDIPPTAPGSRSLALGIFGVKPGTVLAKRLDDDPKQDDATS